MTDGTWVVLNVRDGEKWLDGMQLKRFWNMRIPTDLEQKIEIFSPGLCGSVD